METIGMTMTSSGMNGGTTTCTPTITSGGEIDSRIVNNSCCSISEASSTATDITTANNESSSIDPSDAGQCNHDDGSSSVKKRPMTKEEGQDGTDNVEESRSKTTAGSSTVTKDYSSSTAVVKGSIDPCSALIGTEPALTHENEANNSAKEIDNNSDLTNLPQHNNHGCVSHEDGNYGYLSESRNNNTYNADVEDGEKTPVQPNFCVEGMRDGGDSSVTVAALAALSRNTLVDTEDLDTSITSCCGHGGEGEDSVASGSAPLSVQSSEDMKLSLVSWYSEPEEPTRDCCQSNNEHLISRAVAVAASRACAEEEELAVLNESSKVVETKDIHDKSDEKENKTPMRPGKSLLSSKSAKQTPHHQQQRLKMHVQLSEQNLPCVENGKPLNSSGAVGSMNITAADGIGHGQKKPECPRCARKSKSGTTTPAAPSRTPSRRVVQSSKSTHELKKPIKSILKSDSRSGGSRSGSGSEKQSSMDSLGSASGIACVMTRSDGCTNNRTKFALHNSSFSSCSLSPEDKNTAAKLKRIEKYATLRLKKPRARPTDVGDGDIRTEEKTKSHASRQGNPGVPDIMSKSMSFLEKSSQSVNGSMTGLKRQGSLRLRKPSPLWEPSGTRTSALRMQKVQEAKAKTNNSGGTTGSNSGSNHSGSGESIHVLAANSSVTNGYHHHNGNSNASTNCHHQTQRPSTLIDKHKAVSAKVFSKLSSATGQTTSSAMKRIRQERGVQTDPVAPLLNSPMAIDGHSPTRMSPLPSLEPTSEEADMKRLETLIQRYRARAQKMQFELERSEERNRELQKQLQENQSETNEMIEFLQAEKSLLAESLTEAESEGKKWQDQVESVKKEAQSRCSSLVRLSEQHKQEALKAQALLHRLEVQSSSLVSNQTAEKSEAALEIQQTRTRVVTLVEKLMKTYKVSPELLTSAGARTASDESELNSSLLVPLITALRHAFPCGDAEDITVNTAASSIISAGVPEEVNSCVTTLVVDNGVTHNNTKQSKSPSSTELPPASPPTLKSGAEESNMSLSSSLQNLNQAILEREAAERLGQGTDSMAGMGLDSIHDGDHLSLKTEARKLNEAMVKLVNVVRVIVIQCDKKVSGVTSNILQCLRSIEEDKVRVIPEMMHVQKSLEAWNDSTLCKQPINHSPINKVSCENGH